MWPCVLTYSLGPHCGPGSGLQGGGQVLAGAYGPIVYFQMVNCRFCEFLLLLVSH